MNKIFCKSCEIEKDETEFHKAAKNKANFGRKYICKKCFNERYKDKKYLIRRELVKERRKIDKDYKQKLNKRVTKSHDKYWLRYLYNDAKKRAKQKGIEFNITIDDIIINDVCPLLGLVLQRNRGQLGDNSYSIDRICPELGYVPENVWVISYKANRIKNNATLNELQMITNNLAKYYKC